MSFSFDSEFLKKLELLKLTARRALAKAGEGEKASHKKGASLDFIDFRNYSPGDEPRYVDWNIYARHGKLYIKEFAKEEAISVNIVLDNSPSMDFGVPRKLDYAKKIAAILAYSILLSRDKVAMHILSAPNFIEYTSESEIERICKFLEGVGASDFTFESAFERLNVKSNSVWLVISDFWEFDAVKEKLKIIPAKNSDVGLIHILSPEELSPNLQGKFRLIGVEGGERVDRFIGEAELNDYKRILDQHIESCKSFALLHNMNYVFASTDTDIETFALVYLRKAGILR